MNDLMKLKKAELASVVTELDKELSRLRSDEIDARGRARRAEEEVKEYAEKLNHQQKKMTEAVTAINTIIAVKYPSLSSHLQPAYERFGQTETNGDELTEDERFINHLLELLNG